MKSMAETCDLRTAYAETLVRLMERDQRIVALDAILCRSTMTTLVEQRIPERFIEMGSAEQNYGGNGRKVWPSKARYPSSTRLLSFFADG